MLLNVIFLDIDGVLNPLETNHPHVFSPACVQQLQRILAASPQTHVVFSTTWRYGLSFFALGWLWRQHDLPLGRVLGRTPELDPSHRGEEIQQWLAQAPHRSREHQVHRYAILDDEVKPILETLPANSIFACHSTDGLTPSIAERVIHHFAANTGDKAQ